MKSAAKYFNEFNAISPEMKMLDWKNGADLDLILQDAEKLQAFRTKLFAFVEKRLRLNTITVEQAIEEANKLKNFDEFKDVTSLQSLDFKVDMFDSVLAKYPEKERREIAILPKDSQLSPGQKYEVYQCKKQDPKISFVEMSKILSEKFQARTEHYKTQVFRIKFFRD